MAWGNPAWIVTAPRTGSTYLCYLLNKLNRLPLDIIGDAVQDVDIFGEHYHPKNDVSYPTDWRPNVTKIHWPWVVVQEIELPSRLIVLRRRDTVAQAVSLYLAGLSGRCHCPTEEDFQEYCKLEVAWNAEDAILCHTQCRNWEIHLSKLQGLHVWYEDLLQFPLEVLQECFRFLETRLQTDGKPLKELLSVPLQRLERPETFLFKERLKSVLCFAS